jgi:hypothetical protein
LETVSAHKRLFFTRSLLDTIVIGRVGTSIQPV